MRVPRSWPGLLGTLALAGLAAPVGAQPVGSEFQVNTYTTGYQRTRRYGGHPVAADGGGNFVVVWDGRGQGDTTGVFGQRFDSADNPVGAEFRVNSYTTNDQDYPSVAVAEDGDFVVTWSGRGQGDTTGVFGQRYDSGGAARGAEFRVNSFTTGAQRFPSVASDASGIFVIVWESLSQDGDLSGIFARRYNSGGVPQGGEFRVNTYTTESQRFPSVASDASGNFVIVWDSFLQDGDSLGVFGQRYDSGGVAQGSEFRVNSYTTNAQSSPSVASDASGNFVVVWEGGYFLGDHQIFGQRYRSGGEAQGDEFRVNTQASGSPRFPSVASDAQGNFVVAWSTSYIYALDGESYGQRYDSEGVAQGDEFQINSFTPFYQIVPSVGATGSNQFVVVWESHEGQDGSATGVFGQRYDFGGLPSLSISDVSVTEGNLPRRATGTVALFNVSLSAASTQAVTVDYATANGSAMAPSDYSANSGTLTLSPGQTSGVIAVLVKEDNVPESNENFFVNLSDPVNATIADGQGVGTILNDDP